jgi:hypothetical protein
MQTHGMFPDLIYIKSVRALRRDYNKFTKLTQEKNKFAQIKIYN